MSELFNGSSACCAAFAGPAVDLAAQLEIAQVAVTVSKVTQAAAAGPDRLAQGFTHCVHQLLITLASDTQSGGLGMNTRAEQRFVGIYIANPRYDTAVH